MGWWPFGGSASSDGSSASSTSAPTKPSELLPPVTPASTSQTKPLTREEQADAELNAWFASLERDVRKRSDSPPASSPPASPSQFSPSPNHPTTAPPPEPTDPSKPDISPWALRPRTMSCRQAFDQAFYCASLGGKFNDIYRYGSLQPCSEQWGAFWFCMRTKGYGEEKGEYIARYYEEREKREMLRRSGGRTSEDVWELRTEPVEKAFWRVP